MYNDLGNQRGMMISPGLFRKFIKPFQKENIRMVKDFKVDVFYHSCGGILPIVEDLVEIGIDILVPLQLNTMRVTPSELIDVVEDKIALHGAISVQDLLVSETPEGVRETIHDIKGELGQYGKYILSCSHLIQIDIPFPNIDAIIEEIKT
jgi:uroporphyrinogen decarboxylase